jgi:hypothetical protein
MSPSQQEDLFAKITQESKMAQAGKYVLPVHMDLSIALCVVAALQLALRHPQNKGESAKVVQDVVDQIITRTRADGYRMHAELMELGNDTAFDR